MGEHYQWQEGCLLLRCQLQSRASKDEIVGLQGDRLKIRITAPPVDGKANQHLIALVSRWFGTPKSAVSLLRGETGRQKTLQIENPTRLPDEAAIEPPEI
ncbi:DUF167 family protein [Porticoccus sp.]|uniref:DUF167 family protein n=1 Tax=Porticoccus sp. TaxID=2024853 RepID=UPI003F69EF99